MAIRGLPSANATQAYNDDHSDKAGNEQHCLTLAFRSKTAVRETAHWDDQTLAGNLRDRSVDTNTLSDMSIAALEDMGYDTVYVTTATTRHTTTRSCSCGTLPNAQTGERLTFAFPALGSVRGRCKKRGVLAQRRGLRAASIAIRRRFLAIPATVAGANFRHTVSVS
jgi:hypothetical protein